MHRGAPHVADGRDAVGDKEQQIVLAPGMDMHVGQARHQIFVGAIDFNSTLRNLDLRGFSDFIDEVVLNNNRHPFQNCFALHRHEVDVDKGINRC